MEINQDPPSLDSDAAFNTFIGVLISVCGNVLISVALNVQKLAHNRIQEKTVARYFANMDEPPRWISTTHNYYTGSAFFPDDGYSSPRISEEHPRSAAEELEQQKLIMAMAQESRGGDSDYLKSQLWWLGISLMILGEFGNFVAYGFAPASTIAPLGTTTLVSNVILAPLILKEVFRKRDFLGVLLAVLGAAMVVLSSNAEETLLSPDLIMDALSQTRSIVYFIITGIAIAILTILSPVYGSQSIMIDLGLVAIYGGYTVLCTKSIASLLSLTFFAMFAYTISYLLLFILFVTAVLQIKYLNKALQRFDSTEVIPTQFVLFTISAIMGSAVLYHDFDNMSVEQMSRFMTGCAIEFLGVYLITSKRNKQLQQLSISADATLVEQDEITDVPNRDPENPVPRQTMHNAVEPVPARRSIIQTAPREADRPPLRASSPPEEWAGTLSLNNQRLGHRRRRSSVFRGISLTSQLVDRMNDEPMKRQSIQLPPSSPTWHLKGHFRGDSALGSLFAGLTAPPPPQPQESASTTTDADAVEIEIPTATTLSSQRNSEDDRELLPMNTANSKRNSARLVDIEESAEYRDLN